MRQRFHVTWLGDDFFHAVEVATVFRTEHPDIDFQIRKRAKNKFELVKRLPYTQAVQELAKKEEQMYSRKKRKRSRIA